MDPKTLSNLDPKLRETYERVMGSASAAEPGSTPAPGATAPTQPAATIPAAESPIPTPSASHVVEPTPTLSPATPVMPATEPNPFQTPVMPAAEPPPLPSPASVNQMTDQNASPLIRILYIVGAIVFFIVYTFFWTKVFNLQWPF